MFKSIDFEGRIYLIYFLAGLIIIKKKIKTSFHLHFSTYSIFKPKLLPVVLFSITDTVLLLATKPQASILEKEILLKRLTLQKKVALKLLMHIY